MRTCTKGKVGSLSGARINAVCLGVHTGGDHHQLWARLAGIWDEWDAEDFDIKDKVRFEIQVCQTRSPAH